jgi:broad specificity phosphatase PhoE
MNLRSQSSRRVCFALAVCFTLCVFSAPSLAEEPFKPTTVFLVRHAEKQVAAAGQPMISPNDPPLTEEGKTRAKNLARMLGKAGINTIITSQFLRTKQTAEPLAEALGLTTQVIPIAAHPTERGKVSPESVKNIVDKIFQSGGEAVLVVGHTNTLPEVIAMLGGGKISEIPETDYDNFFVVTVYEKGKAKVARMRF